MDNNYSVDTPMMRQYLEIKKQYKNEILFFRMGDFYEMFLDDAVYASRVLDIALTRRQDKIPMCGIPHHSMQNYIHPILESGRNIAICEQVEDPKTVTGRIVRREVTRILTPGSLFEEDLLNQSERRSLAAVVRDQQGRFTVTVADVSTAGLVIGRAAETELYGYLEARNVREVVLLSEEPLVEAAFQTRTFDARIFTTGRIREIMARKIRVPEAGLELSEEERKTLALLFHYIDTVAPGYRQQWPAPVKEYNRNILLLDEAALKTLEILRDQNQSRRGSLLHTLDFCLTQPGKRLLSSRLSAPSADQAEIEAQLDAVEFLLGQPALRASLADQLRRCGDLERILVGLRNAPQVRHAAAVKETAEAALTMRDLFAGANIPPAISRLLDFSADQISAIRENLAATLLESDLPPLLDERRFVRPGFSPILDELFELNDSAQTVLKDYENREKEKWNISTLKIRYNKVIGYYIEVSKGQTDKVPEVYSRRQTLVNGERYTTEELKNLEDRILNAKEEILTLQRSIFQTLTAEILEAEAALLQLASAVAGLDLFLGFALAAERLHYVRPVLNNSDELNLADSRHPVVEAMFKEEVFIPNDVHLNRSGRHLAILTGPNMAGKSTFIRQIGLIQIMAQAGCFVPARSASLPVMDRIFTRIGAYDRLFRGESTFYVEMSECARIFANFTGKSLILLDEVGRGTATFDGISIARAMIEFISGGTRGNPITLFATHYAELAEMIGEEKGIIGLTVEVHEEDGKIIFLRKIREGSADKSYGIYVAELAGLPPEVTERAKVLLKELEEEGLWREEPVFGRKKPRPSPKRGENQPGLF